MMEKGDTAPGHPGTSGIWTFVFIDMCVFLLFFAVYVSERHRLPDIFTQSQHELEPLVGLASTLALLTSSWAMAEAVHAVRRADSRRAAASLGLALALGGAFVVNKLFE